MNEATGGAAVPQDALVRILQAGLRAPSAENKHHLRFEREGDEVWLLATDQASWTALPHRAYLAMVSYGAVVENMALRAASLGYRQGCRWLPEERAPQAVACLSWRPGVPLAEPLAAAIEARHTNRRFYGRGRVAPAVLARVSAAAAAVEGTRLLWLDAAPDRRLALRMLRLAETERFHRQRLHEELFGAVRFERGWRASCEEGLPPGALEVEPGMRSAFAALRHWPLMRAAAWLGAHHALGLRAGHLPCALAPHLGLVLAEGGDAWGDLQAGRAFERLWLAAGHEGLALQPFAAPVALVRQHAGAGYVSAPTRTALAKGLDLLCAGHDGRPRMLFRMGHAAAPTVVSGRVALERHAAFAE